MFLNDLIEKINKITLEEMYHKKIHAIKYSRTTLYEMRIKYGKD